MTPLSLYELNRTVRSAIEERLDTTYWLQAELSEARTAANGHFYVEFVQHDPDTQAIVAKARGMMWRNTYNMLEPLFERATGEHLRAGMKVLVEVEVVFHEVYGMSLNIVDIDPTYTLGDIAQRRREILERLEREGIRHDNQGLSLPTLLQRVAVISSETAAGYGDFCKQMEQNPYHLRFDITLFGASMQGSMVEESVLDALQQIYDCGIEGTPYDVVVIIRGGGATSDLSDFDTYRLAAAVAQFPIPIIVGIGHERDETVIDSVAHTRAKTPTAAADFIIAHQLRQCQRLADLNLRIATASRDYLQRARLRWQTTTTRVQEAPRHHLQHEQLRLQRTDTTLLHTALALLQQSRHHLQLLQQKTESLDPERLLQRGYTMTYVDGRLVKSIHDIVPGQTLTTKMADGTIQSQTL